jgi:hypothetical protein
LPACRGAVISWAQAMCCGAAITRTRRVSHPSQNWPFVGRDQPETPAEKFSAGTRREGICLTLMHWLRLPRRLGRASRKSVSHWTIRAIAPQRFGDRPFGAVSPPTRRRSPRHA